MTDPKGDPGPTNKGGQKTPQQTPPPGNTTQHWVGLAILLGGLLAFLFWLGSQETNRQELPYTTFKQEVRSGKIAKVTITGQQVRGEYREGVSPSSKGQAKPQAPTNRFTTAIPSFGDTKLMSLLENNGVEVKVIPQGDSWLMPMLFGLLPLVLLIGLIYYSSRRMQDQLGGMGSRFSQFSKSQAKRYDKSTSNITFKDVAGSENAKRELQEIIDYLKDPQQFQKLGAEIPRGILLTGSPGTGKTLMARAVAGEADVPFFSISASQFVEMFVGVGAARVRDMFDNAKKEAPAIIFIDEIDAVGRSRGAGLGGGHDEREQTLNEILSEMDGFESHQAVVVIAATNRPDVLDNALLRPGRFDRKVTIELPQKKARLSILQVHTQDVPLAEDVDLEEIATQTVGFSGADLENLVNEAALITGRNKKDRVDREAFTQARDKVLFGIERDEPLVEKEKPRIAYHEAGHALLNRLLKETDPLRKVSIIPRGRALGATEMVPQEDRYNYTSAYLRDRLAVMLGGRLAEKLVYHDFSTGAHDDLKQVTHLARQMVTQWGMSERLGAIAFRQYEDHVFLGREMGQPKDHSEYTAQLIDQEVHDLIEEQEKRGEEILTRNRDKLDRLAEALLERETLSAAEMDELLGLEASEKDPLPEFAK